MKIDDINDDDGGDDADDDNNNDDDDNRRIIGEHSPLTIKVLDSRSSNLGLSPGLSFCVFFMDKDFTLTVLSILVYASLSSNPDIRKIIAPQLQSIKLHSHDVQLY